MDLQQLQLSEGLFCFIFKLVSRNTFMMEEAELFIQQGTMTGSLQILPSAVGTSKLGSELRGLSWVLRISFCKENACHPAS